VSARGAAALFAPFRRALHQLKLRFFPVRDPWRRLPYEAPLAVFGDGARHGFDWVFDGETAVAVSTMDDIVRWLAECRYESDASLFLESDYWQHPHTFEQLRRGDCEDFALWAWRKLIEIGIDADLVIGRRVPPGAENSRHAWILYRDGGEEFLFEPVLCERGEAVRRVSAVRSEYIPEFGVGADRRRFMFAGYAYFLQNRHLGRARSESGSLVMPREPVPSSRTLATALYRDDENSSRSLP
jgi:hypothetical protein